MGEPSATVATARHGKPLTGGDAERMEQAPSFAFETPAGVLYANELMRGRLWVSLCVLFSLGGMGAALVFEGPGEAAARAAFVGSAFMLVVSLVGVRRLAADGSYGSGLAAIFGYACVAASVPLLIFVGWFSPLVLLIGLGGTVFAMGHSTRSVLMMGTTTVAAHASVGLASIVGVLPAGAIASPNLDSAAASLALLAGCEGLIIISFIIGRRLRVHTLLGVEAYGRVIRENARREALLEEAVAELDRVRRVGEPGRYTGLTVGSFELGVVLGRGGMGEVYEATRKGSGEQAAVKVLAVSGAEDDRTVRRFRREIGLAAAVDSPHVVRVIEHSPAGSAILYLAMERLNGESLAQQLRAVRRPPVLEVLEMLDQVGRGVSAAHAKGIVHRDLTPGNIFHHRGEGRPIWKILDFGVSRLAGGRHTLTGAAVVGTPSYMAPEQASGAQVDPRTDLFALGCVAYRCLTGQPAFRGRSIADVLYHVVHDMPTQPSLLADLPPEVDLVLAIALAKNPDDRFGAPEQLADTLRAACHGTIQWGRAERARQLLRTRPWAVPPRS